MRTIKIKALWTIICFSYSLAQAVSPHKLTEYSFNIDHRLEQQLHFIMDNVKPPIDSWPTSSLKMLSSEFNNSKPTYYEYVAPPRIFENPQQYDRNVSQLDYGKRFNVLPTLVRDLGSDRNASYSDYISRYRYYHQWKYTHNKNNFIKVIQQEKNIVKKWTFDSIYALYQRIRHEVPRVPWNSEQKATWLSSFIKMKNHDGYVLRLDPSNKEWFKNPTVMTLIGTDVISYQSSQPDLIVTNITAPNMVTIGGQFTLSWTVQNQGQEPIKSVSWEDKAYLADDRHSGGPDSLLAFYEREQILNPGQSYTTSIIASLMPEITPGNYYIIIKTDAEDTVSESNEHNNFLTRPITVSPQVKFIITPSSGPNGSIDPYNSVIVDFGDDQLFTAYPDIGYEVDTWYLDDETVQTGGATYKLYNIQADHMVHVTFKQLLGYSLNKIEFNSDEEFSTHIAHNNSIDPDHPEYNLILVERVTDFEPDPQGVMFMQNLRVSNPELPNFGQTINARAKGLFTGTNASKVQVCFNYLFNVFKPNVVLLIYVSDIPDLLAHDDPLRPYHYVEAGCLFAPPPFRPGSAGSRKFGVFEKTVSVEHLNLSKCTYVELELVEMQQEASPRYFSINNTQLKSFLSSSDSSTSVAVDSFGPEVHCDGICLDITWDNFVNELDFLIVVGGCGCSAGLLPGGTGSRACLEGAFSDDGYVDPLDISSWDWTLNLDARKNLCTGVPLTWETAPSSSMALDFRIFSDPTLSESFPNDLSDLLIVGKRMASDPLIKMEDCLYIFDRTGQYLNSYTPSHTRCNIRLVRAHDGQLYRVNSETGIVRLNGTDEVAVPHGQTTYSQEPRYNMPATIYIGIQDQGSDSFGRPLLDAAFDENYVYVVPVVVDPEGEEPYTAAAKLQLFDSASPPYKVVKLYDDPPLVNDNQCRNSLREIELDEHGNVYVINAHSLNESNILWRFYQDGTYERFDLNSPDSNCCICDPIAMCVSDVTDTLYVASAQYNLEDVDSTMLYAFSTSGAIAFERTITIGGMQHITGITEDQNTGCLWIVGFNMEDIPQYPNPYEFPFYSPCLAKVTYGVNSVQAQSISNSNDLALPMSIVWTSQAKCDRIDLNKSGNIDFTDFAILAGHWLDSDCASPDWCAGADIGENSIVDLLDFIFFSRYWLQQECLN